MKTRRYSETAPMSMDHNGMWVHLGDYLKLKAKSDVHVLKNPSYQIPQYPKVVEQEHRALNHVYTVSYVSKTHYDLLRFCADNLVSLLRERDLTIGTARNLLAQAALYVTDTRMDEEGELTREIDDFIVGKSD